MTLPTPALARFDTFAVAVILLSTWTLVVVVLRVMVGVLTVTLAVSEAKGLLLSVELYDVAVMIELGPGSVGSVPVGLTPVMDV